MITRTFFLLRGGLGNQLFQWAGMSKLSKTMEVLFLVSDLNTYYSRRSYGTTESFLLPVSTLFEANLKPRILKSESQLPLRMLISFGTKSRFVKRTKEGEFSKLSRWPITVLEGYFQDRSYVDELPLLTLNELFNIQDAGSKIRVSSDKVCIHIRGTDYPESSRKKFNEQYYSSAIRKFENWGYTKFDCYTDDMKYAHHIMRSATHLEVNYPEKSGTLGSLELLRTMSKYKQFICSPSSLNWWAAYISIRNDETTRVVEQFEKRLSLRS